MEAIKLLDKYSARIPRYTSYPTAVDLKPSSFDIEQLKNMHAENINIPHALYIHIPFCHSLCYFCACNKVITKDNARYIEYVEALEKEIELLGSLFNQKFKLSSIHFGGGSPSVLQREQLEQLICTIQKNFESYGGAIKSIELDPRTTDLNLIQTLAALGFRRASLGIQDFDPFVQELVNRKQSFELVAQKVEELRQNHFESINFDLIYGLPGQTHESLKETIEKVTVLRPDRIALYGYAHVANKVKVQRVFDKYELPDSRKRYELFSLASSMLTQSGYFAIGMDHFAKSSDSLFSYYKEGRLKRNFMGYTGSEEERVLGLGASALSDTGEWMYQNETDTSAYVKRLKLGELPVTKALRRSKDDSVRARIIEELMCNARLNLISNEEDRDHAIKATIPQFEPFIKDKLLSVNENELRVSELGRFFLRNIAAQFDKHLSKHAGEKFSVAH